MSQIATVRAGRSPIVMLSFMAVITCGALVPLLPFVKQQMEQGAPVTREESVAQVVEITATSTPVPHPTTDWMIATANAGNAQAAQLAAQAAQVDLRNAQLAGTITSDRATLDAVVIMAESSDRRTMTAAQATSQSASTATAEAEMMRIASTQAAVDAEIERGLGIVWVLALALAAIVAIGVAAVIVMRAWLLFEPVVIDAAMEASRAEEREYFDSIEIPEFTNVGNGGYIDAVRHGGFPNTPAEWVVKFSRRVVNDRAFRTAHYSDVPAGDNGRKMWEAFLQRFVDNGLAIKSGTEWVPTERGIRMARILSNPPTVADVDGSEN